MPIVVDEISQQGKCYIEGCNERAFAVIFGGAGVKTACYKHALVAKLSGKTIYAYRYNKTLNAWDLKPL